MGSLARTLMVGVLSFGLSVNVFATNAFAQHGELRSSSLFQPDSPLFALQHLLDAWEEFLAFDALDEASVQAKLADNRLAEVAAMIHQGRPDIAASLATQMAELVEKASARLVEAIAAADRDGAGSGVGSGAGAGAGRGGEGAGSGQGGKAAVIAKLIERLTVNAERQEAVLTVLVEKFDRESVGNDKATIEKLKSAIDKAMERSAFGLENAIRRVSGERGPAAPTTRPAATPTAPTTGQPDATPTRPVATPTAPATGQPDATPTRPEATPVAPAEIPGRPEETPHATPTAPVTGQPAATPARPAATPTAPATGQPDATPTAPAPTARPTATPTAPAATPAAPAATAQPQATPVPPTTTPAPTATPPPTSSP